MGNKIISCKDLVKIYTTSLDSNIKVSALKGVDCDVYLNDLIAIIGPSGSGKTTLLKIMSFLDLPSSGGLEYNFEGGKFNLTDKKLNFENLRKNHIGILYQEPKQNLFYNLNGYENIIFPMKIGKKFNTNEQHQRVKSLLAFFDLKKIQNSKPHMLSGGEAQRLAFCVALANNPSIIFLDEPTGELDKNNKELMLKYIYKVHKELKKTIIIVSHDLELYKDFNRLFFLSNGKLSIFSKSKETESPSNVITIGKKGEIRISFYYLQRLGIKGIGTLEFIENQIRISTEKSDESLRPNEELVLITTDGMIIIPKSVREKFDTKIFNIVLKENFLELNPIIIDN